MMNKIIILLLILLVNCGGNKQPVNQQDDIAIYNIVKQKRADNSPTINSLNGVSDDYLRWIDESMADLSADISVEGREFNINPSVVDIYVLHTCELSPVQRVPSFKVKGDNQYDQTIYDINPAQGIVEIYAAEYVIWKDRKLTNSWIICLSDDETYVKSASRYGYEHKFLYDNYPAEYENTKTHTEGINHPLIPVRGQ